MFDAQILQNQIPKNLFVGKLDRNTKEITLLEFQLQESFSHELPKILSESARIIIERIYKTALLESLDDIWKDIATSKQLDVQVVRNFILKDLPTVLRMLGIQNIEVKNHLCQWWDADIELTELARRQSSDGKVSRKIGEANDKLNNAKESLKNLIETKEEVADSILEAVRQKIGQYGYDLSSIPFGSGKYVVKLQAY